MAETLRDSRYKSDHSPLAGLTDRPLGLPATAAAGVLPIVAIGASAGGIAAVAAFLTGLAHLTDQDVAYILIQHLPADGARSLVARLQQATHLQVCEIEDGMTIQANLVYVGPGDWHVAIRNGSLQLHKPPTIRMDCLPIDFLFRSLAEDQGRHATGIIFSGAGSDGSIGLRAIKAQGGMVMVQAPDSAAYGGMPRSAIATSMVDIIVAPEAMGSQLCHYLTYGFGRLEAVTPMNSRGAAAALETICGTLHSVTGLDFSGWGHDTITSRIQRRMTLQQIDTPARYNKFLRQSPAEISALCRELLIGTTTFFEQPEALAALVGAVGNLVKAETFPTAPLRIWVPGCSTGEEVYSLAILLDELLQARPHRPVLQIFATDSDQKALTIARRGIYPASSLAAMTPERLSRYFTRTDDGRQYHLDKELRNTIIFAEHDLLCHQPFSNLNLIYCRDFAKHLTVIPPQRLLSYFYTLLPPGGILGLGQSGIDGQNSTPFRTIDQRHNILQRPELPGPSRQYEQQKYCLPPCCPPLS